MSTVIYRSTNRWSGKCEACVYPVVRELPEDTRSITRVDCPGCGQPVRITRLFGAFTDKNCDGACQNALGPECVCGCGGANHQRGYIPLIPNGEVSYEVLTAYRKRVANIEAGADKRALNRAAKKAELAAAEAALVSEAIDKFAELCPTEYAWLLANYDNDYFAGSLYSQLNRRGYLSDPQIEAITNSIEREAKKAAEALLPVSDAPSGTQTFTGTILSVKDEPGYTYNSPSVWKMLVRAEAGWKSWGTVPSSLADAYHNELKAWHVNAGYAHGTGPVTGAGLSGRSLDGLRNYLVGSQVTLTAEIVPTERDPRFAIAKRPRKATLNPVAREVVPA
jgi:hypothetical protein